MESAPLGPGESLTAIGLDLGLASDQPDQLDPASAAEQPPQQMAESTPIPADIQNSPSATPSGSPGATRKRGGRHSSAGTAKRPRPSQATSTLSVPVEQVLDFLNIPLPHHELIHRTGTIDDPHLIRIKTGVSDGTHALIPALEVPGSKRDGLYLVDESLQRGWRIRIGKAIATMFQWRKLSTAVFD